jgi:Kef-type K+ transport system membrane component KefB
MADEYVSLLIASIIAFLMPFVARRVNIPVMVGEIVLGIVVGFASVGVEQITGEAFLTFETESHAYFLSEIGLIFLLFLAGMEIDFNMIGERGPFPLLKGVVAFVATFTIALVVITLIGLESPLFLALVISTTSLGVVIPVVRELGITRSQYGQDLILGAIIADFGTMLMIPLVIAMQKGDSLLLPAIILPLIAIFFFGLYFFGGYIIWRWPNVIERFFIPHDPNETGVRASFLLIMVFVVLSQVLETELILGAFLAGAAIAFLFRETGTLESKLFGFGYGFLIPLFFVRVGVAFAHTVTEPGGMEGLLIIPALIVFTYLAKVLPSIHLTQSYGVQKALAHGFLLSGGLSLAIVAAEIGLAEDVIGPEISAAIIFFAIVMAIASPIAFRMMYLGKRAEDMEEEQIFELVTITGEPLEGGVDTVHFLNGEAWEEAMEEVDK